MANFVVKVVDGKPVIFGSAGKDTGVPCYVFEDEEAYDAAMAEGLNPVGSLIFKTYDGAEMAGGPFDTELGDSDNAVQNRVVKAAIDRIDQSIAEALALRASLIGFGLAKICPIDVVNITEANGILCGGFEKNSAVEGSLANKISIVDSKFETHYSLKGGQDIPGGSDLNAYMNVGNYFCTGNDIAESILNCPIAHAFTMKVELGSGLAYPTQTIRDFFTGDIYFRMRDERQWNRWRKSTFTEI